VIFRSTTDSSSTQINTLLLPPSQPATSSPHTHLETPKLGKLLISTTQAHLENSKLLASLH